MCCLMGAAQDASRMVFPGLAELRNLGFGHILQGKGQSSSLALQCGPTAQI